MTKSKFISTMALALLGVALVTNAAFSQVRGKPSPVAAHKVGLIDIEEVFSNYDKFKMRQEELKAEAEQSGAYVQNAVKRLKQGEKQLRDPTIKKGSVKYNDLEAKLIKQKAALDADVKNKERDFMRRRAKIFKMIHGEVQDMVEVYAEKKGYTLVMRFRRPKFDDEDPRSVAMNLNSTVIYHRGADDITDIITGALNRHYAQTAGGASKRDEKVRPAGGTRTTQPRSRTAKPGSNRRIKN